MTLAPSGETIDTAALPDNLTPANCGACGCRIGWMDDGLMSGDLIAYCDGCALGMCGGEGAAEEAEAEADAGGDTEFPVDLGGGYSAVPWDAVTPNGVFIPHLAAVAAEWGSVAVLGKDGRALVGETGLPFRYPSIAAAREDVEILIRVSADADSLFPQVPEKD